MALCLLDILEHFLPQTHLSNARGFAAGIGSLEGRGPGIQKLHKDQEVALRRPGVPGWRECLNLWLRCRGGGENIQGRAQGSSERETASFSPQSAGPGAVAGESVYQVVW